MKKRKVIIVFLTIIAAIAVLSSGGLYYLNTEASKTKQDLRKEAARLRSENKDLKKRLNKLKTQNKTNIEKTRDLEKSVKKKDTSKGPPEGFKVHTDSSAGLKMNYPESWEKQEKGEGGVEFTSPKEDDSDSFQEYVEVKVEDLSEAMTLDEYTEASLDEIREFYGNLDSVERSEKITFAGGPAHSIVYASELGGKDLKWMEVWTIRNQKVYRFKYAAQEDKYDDFLGAAENILNSTTLN